MSQALSELGGFRVDSYRRDFEVDSRAYAGLEVGRPWPEPLDPDESRRAGYEDEWETVSELAFVMKYCSRLQRGVGPLRVLGIDFGSGRTSLPSEAEFIGFDVCVSGGSYSLLGQDVLAREASEAAGQFSGMLNRWGLVRSRGVADAVIEECRRHPEAFDTTGGETIAAVWWIAPSLFPDAWMLSAAEAFLGKAK